MSAAENLLEVEEEEMDASSSPAPAPLSSSPPPALGAGERKGREKGERRWKGRKVCNVKINYV